MSKYKVDIRELTISQEIYFVKLDRLYSEVQKYIVCKLCEEAVCVRYITSNGVKKEIELYVHNWMIDELFWYTDEDKAKKSLNQYIDDKIEGYKAIRV